ncbi:uncharacterized protein LOC141853129 [Brevipalpus obovatus]|uniref:uncharacterized protein LOC141853129 n=1 Tax=Brevipalpus obovatus TaxID=246614 RepID=UPI003D9EF6B8
MKFGIFIGVLLVACVFAGHSNKQEIDKVRALREKAMTLLGRLWTNERNAQEDGIKVVPYEVNRLNKKDLGHLLDELKVQRNLNELAKIEEKLDIMEVALPSLTAMVERNSVGLHNRDGVQTRTFLGTVQQTWQLTKILWEKRQMILEAWPAIMSTLQAQGLQGVLELIKPAVQEIMNDSRMAETKEQVEMMAQKIENFASALAILQQFGDNSTTVDSLTKALDGLAIAGEYLTGTSRDITQQLAQDMLVSKIVSNVIAAEGSPVNFMGDMLDKLCPMIV